MGQALEQPARVGMKRPREEARHRGHLDDAPGIDHGHAMAQLGDHSEIVGDQEHGHAPLGLETAQQVEDLRLDGDVEGRGRLIGDEKGGPAGESHGDHGALAQPAGELVGKVAGPLGCRGNLDELEHLDGARPRFLATGPAVGEHGGRNLVADGEHGIERGHRLLEHHGDARAAHPAHGLGVHGEEILALEEHAARGHPARRLHEPHDGQRRDALAAPALPDQPQHLALVDGEAHAVHRAEHSLGGGEMRLQPFHREQWRHVSE